MLDMHRHERSIRLLTTLGLFLALGFAGACSSTIAFSDKSPVVVVGDRPIPKIAPMPKVEPPKPKRVEVTADKIVITEKIQFDTDKSTIKPESNGLLDEIVGVIQENPRIKKLSIEGHTDGVGSDKYNLKLSDGRAQAVMAYLTEHGVEAARLTAKGFGETKPIGSNDTEEGKEQNRRVEFLIVDQDEVKQTFEIDPKTGERKEVESKPKKAPKAKEEKAP